MRCSTPESPQGRIAGAQSDCCAENSAEPVVRGAKDVRRRKVRRAELQGRKVIAAPKTRQSLLSGEHKMFDAGKSAGPNCRGAK